MSFKDNKIYPVVFTFIYSFIFILVLTLVYSFTREKISDNEKLFEKQAILSALGISYQSPEEVFELYDREVTEKVINDRTYYFTGVDGDTVASIKFTGSALWGTVTGVIAVNEDLTRINGLSIISHSETPGLGGRIEEEWFTSQFSGERIVNDSIKFDSKSSGKGNYDHEDGVVDSVTGASRTSESLEKIVNEYLKIFKEEL